MLSYKTNRISALARICTILLYVPESNNCTCYSEDLITRISTELKSIKEGMKNFKEMQVDTMKENYLRLQEHTQLSNSLNEMASRFEKLVKKFTSKEEESL